MARSSPRNAGGERAGIIAAVRSPLGFFALVVLVVESALGAIALGADGTGRREAMVAMLGVTLLLVAVVAAFAWRKPQALLGGDGAETDAQGSRSAQWESSAACATPAEQRIFYAWRGWHPAEPGRP